MQTERSQCFKNLFISKVQSYSIMSKMGFKNGYRCKLFHGAGMCAFFLPRKCLTAYTVKESSSLYL